MGPWIPALIGALAELAVSWVGRMLISLGITTITYAGIATGLDVMKQLVISKFQGLPSDVLNLMGLLGLDVAITLMFSAFAFRLSLRTINGSIKKFIAK